MTIKTMIKSMLRPIWKPLEARFKAQLHNSLAEMHERLIVVDSALNNAIASLNNLVDLAASNSLLFNDPYDTYVARGMRKELEEYDPATLKSVFLRLIHGLDCDSITTVAMLLNRLKVVANKEDGKSIDIFTDNEKEQLRVVKEKFTDQILALDDECFFYNGYFLPVATLESSIFYYKCCLDYITNLNAIKEKHIVDAGGFIGDSALILSPLTNQKVHVFEPVKANAELMQKTFALNAINNAIIAPYALGNQISQMEIMVNNAGSTLGGRFNEKEVRENWPKEIVNLITLDSYVAKHDIKVGLIKIDVEGFEQPLLQGALNTIKEQKPALLVSIYHSIHDFLNIKPMLEDLNLGYKFKIVKPVDGRLIAETMLIAQVG